MITIIDDFISDVFAHEIRARAIEAGFKDEVSVDGAVYHGIGRDFDPCLKLHIEMIFDRKIVPRIGVFRRDKAGMFSYNTCHSDKICADYVALLYLSDPRFESGGTAFFRHKESGFIQHPAPRFEGDELPAALEADWTDQSKWDIHMFSGMAFRRLIVYPSTYYHGRFPREGFGDTDANSRLIYLLFFDVDKNPDSENSAPMQEQITRAEFNFQTGPTSPLNNDQKRILQDRVEREEVVIVDSLPRPTAPAPEPEPAPAPEPEPSAPPTVAAPDEAEDSASVVETSGPEDATLAETSETVSGPALDDVEPANTDEAPDAGEDSGDDTPASGDEEEEEDEEEEVSPPA